MNRLEPRSCKKSFGFMQEPAEQISDVNLKLTPALGNPRDAGRLKRERLEGRLVKGLHVF